jgi:pimeloyl-ACP methyl ester carboxylesterase
MYAMHGDIRLAYEASGDGGNPLLLIQGIGQLISWPDELCDLLCLAGFHVARFDHRDSGLSSHLDELGTPSPLRLMLRPGAAAPYSLLDMTHDAMAVMDALGWSSTHVLGFSQGGMIAQKLATIAPERVRTLTSIASTPAPRIGRPTAATLIKIAKIARRPVKSVDDYVQHMLDLQALTSTPRYPVDEPWLRSLAARSYERCYDQAGVQRLSAAFQGSGDRRGEMASVRCPALVMHGDADVIIRPAAGAATAAAIPAAEYTLVPNMGHDLPRALWPQLVARLAQHAGLSPIDAH